MNWFQMTRELNLTERQWHEEAIQFFCQFDNCHRQTFLNWRKKFQEKVKNKRKEITEIIMEEWGGSHGGRYKDVPSPEYLQINKMKFISPSHNGSFSCTECQEIFKYESESINHFRTNHEVILRKAFRKHANENVDKHEAYCSWLQYPTEIENNKENINIKYKQNDPVIINQLTEEIKLLKKCNQILKDNEHILKETVKNQENTFQIVKERSSGPNILDVKRTVLKENSNGSISKTILKEQVAKISTRDTRKRTYSETENDDNVRKTDEALRKQAKVVDNILNHLSGKDFDTKCSIIAKLIDQEGAKFVEILTANSKEIQQKLKFTPEQTAALISGTKAGDNVWTKFRTASNKTFGWNQLSSHKKVKHVRNTLLPIDRNDWEEIYPSLYKNKQGKNTREQSETCVLIVKDMKSYIQKMAQSESNHFSELKNGDEIHVCYDADGGGGRFIAEFAFINRKDEDIVLHPFIIYEGTDIRQNLENTLGKLTNQFKNLEGAKISINGKTLKITQFGVFDLCALNTILGKQNHSSTYFDAWTNVTIDHIRNHKNKAHVPQKCKDIQFLKLSDYNKNLTHHVVDTGRPLLHFLYVTGHFILLSKVIVNKI